MVFNCYDPLWSYSNIYLFILLVVERGIEETQRKQKKYKVINDCV